MKTETIKSIVIMLCCMMSNLAFSNNNDYSRYESWCEIYINTYEVLWPECPDCAIEFMEVPDELNDYLIKSARKGDFRLLKYAAAIALIVDAEVAKKSITSSPLAGTGAENNGFVRMLLKASSEYKDFESYEDECFDRWIDIIRVNVLADLVRENSIKLTEKDYNYTKEKFTSYLKRKNYGLIDECSRVLHISDSIVYKITPYDKIRKLEFETLDYIDINCIQDDLAKCNNLESIEIRHPQNLFHTKDGVLYFGDILLFYPPKKKDRSIKLPNNVLNFDAKNNPYLEEIQFTDAQFDDFSVNVSNCKNIRIINSPRKLLYMKTDSLDYIGGKSILVNKRGE